MDYQKYTKLEFRRKFFKLLGAEIKVTDPVTEQQVGYIEMKAWKLREDIRLYSDATKSQELLKIRARNIMDFNALYDVFDGNSDTRLFSFRRKGLRSAFLRDHWTVLSTDETEIGTVQETSSNLALIRRYVDFVPFIGWIIDLLINIFVPVTYRVSDTAGASGGNLMQRKNPFIVKFGIDTTEANSSLDPRLPVAIVALMSVIDAGKD